MEYDKTNEPGLVPVIQYQKRRNNHKRHIEEGGVAINALNDRKSWINIIAMPSCEMRIYVHQTKSRSTVDVDYQGQTRTDGIVVDLYGQNRYRRQLVTGRILCLFAVFDQTNGGQCLNKTASCSTPL